MRTSWMLIGLLMWCCWAQPANAQRRRDSISVARLLHDTGRKAFNPRTATIRSAIIPGWGQIYNKKYWKLPLVYGALGTTAGIFFYNLEYYNLLRDAYILKTDSDPNNDVQIDPRFRSLSNESIKAYRNSFRQSVDYSVLFFLLFWGLNVVDATVDAHLKAFDVNDNLSFRFQPGYSKMAGTSGLSLVFDLHSAKAAH